MAYLELADNDPFHNLSAPAEELYIFVPNDESGQDGIYVREDYFDDLPAAEWENVMMQLAPYQPEQLSGIFSGMKERIAERRERRTDRRETRATKRETRAAQGGIFGGIGKSIAGIFGGGGQQALAPDTSTRDFSVGFTDTPPSFLDKNKAWLIPVGIVTVVGGIYLATKKKK